MDCAVAVQGMRGGQWEPLIKKSSALVFINKYFYSDNYLYNYVFLLDNIIMVFK